ncbi:MAG: hypothetical protein QY326_01275 [Bdellovibrionota bacterium]|nr:MAG: hypothetical protein QY326_01275 [Bdellovibrionota bacterium]
MASAIILENGANEEQVLRTLAQIQGAGIADTILIGTMRPRQPGTVCSFIAENKMSVASAMRQAALIAKSNMLLFVDARIDLSSQAHAALSSFLQSGSQPLFAYAALTSKAGRTSFPSTMTKSSVVEMIGSQELWPLAMVATTKTAMREMSDLDGSNSQEVLAQFMMRQIAQGTTIESMSVDVSMNSEESTASLNLGLSSRARCLRTIVSHSNIEELFPKHPWGEYQMESAAASYHMVAASFIRYGDTTSALEALEVGDQLAPSPRSLALKGLIALARGEVLGAVANMVSSLQQYELRRDGANYPSISPENMEGINSKLRAGLEALHERNNDKALEHFAEAVFTFDPFYKDCGISDPKALIN